MINSEKIISSDVCNTAPSQNKEMENNEMYIAFLRFIPYSEDSCMSWRTFSPLHAVWDNFPLILGIRDTGSPWTTLFAQEMCIFWMPEEVAFPSQFSHQPQSCSCAVHSKSIHTFTPDCFNLRKHTKREAVD